ncbi:MAG: DUF4097 family beta strand repeat-containing protein [Bryobacteraceae bacterium]
MKRSSLVAPLVLIGIGALFLARNFYQDLPMLDWLARYWPFVLIGWGAIRLVEIFAWSASNKPLPDRGISGGEWVLIVFLTLFGYGLLATRQAEGWWRNGRVRIGGLEMFGENYEYPLGGELKSGKTPVVVIESFRGNARITGADVDTVKVTGRKSVRSLEQKDADKADKDTPLEVILEGGRVIIRPNQERSGNARISAEFDIIVPKGSSVEARGRRGDFDISGIDGGVDISSDNAGVRLSGIGGSVKIDTRNSDIIRATNVKGEVEVRGRGSDLELENIGGAVIIGSDLRGTIQFRGLAKPLRFESSQTTLAVEKIPGLVRMELGELHASDIVGPIRLTSRTKDVQISNFTQSLEISIDRGDIEVRPARTPLGKIDVHTRSGDIDFAAPAAAKFQMNAETNRGELTNDYGSPLKIDNTDHGGVIKGAVGAGPDITLTTGRGAITIRKSTGEEATSSTTKVFPRLPEAPLPPKAPVAPMKPLEQF